MNNKSNVPYFILRLDSCCTNNTPNRDSNDEVDVAAAAAPTEQQQSLLYHNKALFTVPEDVTAALIVHPILCCGSSFHFVLDNFFPGTHPPSTGDPTSRAPSTAKTTFISTTFDSIDPESTAYQISLRLSIRIQNIRNAINEEIKKSSDINNNTIRDKNIQANIVASQKDWAKIFF
jgi:hypothetical protein